MRTRFLNIDFFSPSSSSPPQTLGLLCLPVPHLPPSSIFTLPEAGDLCFDALPTVDVSHELDIFRIDTALSKLLEDVIPHTIDVADGDFEAAISGIAGFEDGKVECKTSGDADDGSGRKTLELVQFEIPELGLCLEDFCISGKEDMDIFSEVPLIENNLDKHSPGTRNLYSQEAEESVYSIQDICLENLMEAKADLAEDDCSIQGPDFCLLEVDDISMGIPVSMSMEDELVKLLEQIETEHLAWKDDLRRNSEKVLSLLEYQLLMFPSHDFSLNKFPEDELPLELFMELDFIRIGDTHYVPVSSAFCQETPNGNGFLLHSSIVLEELQIIDKDLVLPSEILNLGQVQEPKLCKEMSPEYVSCKSFDELIVSRELALVDDVFKSLPIPVLPECEGMMALHEVAKEVFMILKPQPSSASDGIYLDWHLLEEKCSSSICSFYQDILEGIDTQGIDFDLTTAPIEQVIIDLVLSDYSSTGPKTEEYQESPDTLFSGLSMLNPDLAGAAASEFIEENKKPACQMLQSEANVERTSLLFNSVSPFNDLDFFLNPSKDRPDGENVIVEKNPEETIQTEQSKVSTCVSGQLQQTNIIVTQVHLSPEILAVIEILKTSYLDIFEGNPGLKAVHKSFNQTDSFHLLRVSKQVLLDCFKNLSIQRSTLPNGDELIMSFATLCAIKQLAWYMCFYGIHTARTYIDELCKNLKSFPSRFRALQGSFSDIQGREDVARINSHPSLSLVQEILLSNTTENDLKALVLADKVFWTALKNLLTSMGLSFHAVNESYRCKDECDSMNQTSKTMNHLVVQGCLLATPEDISADFPFHKFKIILEYGGYCGSSRMPTLLPKLNGLPCFHFLKMEMEKLGAARALCDGVSAPWNRVVKREEKSPLVKDIEGYMGLSDLEELLNYVPHEYSVETKNRKEPNAMRQVPCEQFTEEPMPSQSRMMSFPDSVIVVNTQNSDKEMIVSRRSTYQKILSLEKEGIQVVERDSNLPVDIMISPAVSLVWYEYKNIAKETAGANEAYSWLSSYIENIAANILSVLSFSFSGCILIFEGGSGFLTSVMESSDGLYAAAASLGIDLQLFCSYSPELTDEIILRCIASGTEFIKGLFPKLPESETLAESFLGKFPSINPLSAHAILSNGGMLVNFLEWSLESRISAVQRYNVPNESVSLFSILCRYGEREDSQSIMIDSSSSVSSCPDSKNHEKLDYGRKRCKYTKNPHTFDVGMDDLPQYGPSQQLVGNTVKFTGSSYDSSISKDLEIFNDVTEFDFSLKKFLSQRRDSNSAASINPSGVAYPHDFHIPKDNIFSDTVGNRHLHRKNDLAGQNSGSGMDKLDKLDWDTITSSSMREEVRGEVIDVTDSTNPMEFHFSFGDGVTNSLKKPKSAGGFSCAQMSHLTFPTVAEIDSSSYMRSPAKRYRQTVLGETDVDFLTATNVDQMPRKYQKNLVNEDMEWRPSGNSDCVPLQEEGTNYRGTPLRNALYSSNLQKGSPWTIEFLNRIREKSKLRQHSLPSEASPSPSVRRNRSNSIKRRGPSILEFFKFQGSNSHRKTPDRKSQKRSSQSLDSLKNEKTSGSLSQSWTPLDKKSRRMLSFTANTSGSQTKLVWNDISPHNQG